MDVSPEWVLKSMVTAAEKTESVVRVKGTFNGVPVLIIVATGATVGVVERKVKGSGLTLEDDFSIPIEEMD